MTDQTRKTGIAAGLAIMLIICMHHHARAEDPIGDRERGKTDYSNYCSPCHGQSGNGRGPMAALLDPRPTDHRDTAYMNTLPDGYLTRLIRHGGRGVGKSPAMAAWGDILSEQQIRNLIAYMRTLGQ